MASAVPGKHLDGFVKPHEKSRSEQFEQSLEDAKIKRKIPAPKARKKKSSDKKFLKILLWISILVVIYFFWSPIKFQMLRVLQLNPTVWAVYLQMSHEIAAQTLLGLFLTAFFGAMFFVSIPVELVFLYYLSLRFSPWEVIFYVTLGNLIGMMFNYLVGFILGPKVMKKWLKKKYDMWQKRTEKYGGFLLIGGNIIPFPIELVSLFVGGVRYNIFKFFMYTFVGKVIKFALLYFGYAYFSQELSWFWEETLWPPIKSLYEAYILPLKGFF